MLKYKPMMSAKTNEVSTKKSSNLPIVTLQKCLESNCYFGNVIYKTNPKMKDFIYCSRKGFNIIDLNKTLAQIIKAYNAMRDIVENNGKILFVGTKKKVKLFILREAMRSDSFYVVNRWLGGTLTNFKTIQKRIRYYKDLERASFNGLLKRFSKKEQILFDKKKEKLSKNLEGIKEMRKIPQAIFVVNIDKDNGAIKEAKKLGMKIFAIVNTNNNPDGITFPIPANNENCKSVELILGIFADAIAELKGGNPMFVCKDKESISSEKVMEKVIEVFDKKIEQIRLVKKKKNEILKKMQQEKKLRDAFRHDNVQEDNDNVKEVKKSIRKSRIKKDVLEDKNKITDKNGQDN